MEFPVLCLSCLSTLNSVSLFLRCTFAFSSTCCLSSSDPATYFNPSPATSHNLLFSSSLYYVIPLLYFKPSLCVECLLLAWCSPLRAPCGIAFLGRQEVTQSRQGKDRRGTWGWEAGGDKVGWWWWQEQWNRTRQNERRREGWDVEKWQNDVFTGIQKPQTIISGSWSEKDYDWRWKKGCRAGARGGREGT